MNFTCIQCLQDPIGSLDCILEHIREVSGKTNEMNPVWGWPEQHGERFSSAKNHFATLEKPATTSR
jgi:hypothetical protein